MIRGRQKPVVPSLAPESWLAAATEPPGVRQGDLHDRLLPSRVDLALILLVGIAGVVANFVISAALPYLVGDGTMLNASIAWLELSNCTMASSVSSPLQTGPTGSIPDQESIQCTRFLSPPAKLIDRFTTMRRSVDSAWTPVGLHVLALFIVVSHAATAVSQ